MHAGFCSSMKEYQRYSLYETLKKTCHELSTTFYKILPFHACVFLKLVIYTISVILVDDIEKTSLEENTISFVKC